MLLLLMMMLLLLMKLQQLHEEPTGGPSYLPARAFVNSHHKERRDDHDFKGTITNFNITKAMII
jgi:hypothetical protein